VKDKTAKDEPITIKKYANRRLYNTATSSYVTLEHLSQMVRDGQEFVVHDAKTGENITHQVLTQIIVEEEAKGQTMLPIGFLRQLIRLYGDSLQAFVPRYLEYSMDTFSRNQSQIREQLERAFGGMFPFGEMERLSRQNFAMFQRAMSMFTPFAQGAGGGTDSGGVNGASGAGGGENSEREDIATLKERLNQMQAELDRLARRREGE
jgi:polyhydroxyalkanoate synthesis repressor PhaR